MKKAFLILTVILLQLSLVSAINFDAEISPIKDKINLEGAAEFKITLFNNEDTEQLFKVRTIDYPRWFLYFVPDVNPKVIEVMPNANASAVLLLDPNQNYIGKQGSHFVNLEITAMTSGETKIIQPKVGIVELGSIIREYVPTVTVEVQLPGQVNPGEDFDFKVTLKNQNKLNITNAKLVISSKLINEEIPLNILPLEEKTVKVEQGVDPKTPPSGDMMTVDLWFDGKSVDKVVKDYQIIGYSKLTDDSSVKTSLLQKSNTITFTNKGNVAFDGQLRVETSFWKKLFTSTNPKAAAIKEAGKRFYVWDATLEPFESKTVTVRENYLGITILIVAIALIALIIFMKRSPIQVRKEVTVTHTDAEGISKVKILLNIKNRSHMKMDDISVIDKVPKLLDIEKHTTLGSMRPSKLIKNKKHETLILWKLEELQNGEERVITYHLQSHLKIIGGLTLQPAMAEFRVNGKVVKTRSNAAKV